MLAQFFLEEGDMTATDQILFPYTARQGMTLGEMLTELMQLAYCDVTITPIYDPAKPGILGQINIVPLAGQYRPGAIFGWDMGPRSLRDVSRLLDGTQRVNHIRFFGGKAGAPMPIAEDSNSIAAFGIYDEEQWFPDAVQPWQYGTLQNLSAQEVDFRKRALLSVTILPMPERSPRPFQDYELADWMPVYWTDHFRDESILTQRVTGITISLSDDSVETVTELLVVVSPYDQPQGFPGGPPAIQGPDVNIAEGLLRSAGSPARRGGGGTAGGTSAAGGSGFITPGRVGP
jgi:hypothetical protein